MNAHGLFSYFSLLSSHIGIFHYILGIFLIGFQEKTIPLHSDTT